MSKRRNHDAAFKTRVAMEAPKSQAHVVHCYKPTQANFQKCPASQPQINRVCPEQILEVVKDVIWFTVPAQVRHTHVSKQCMCHSTDDTRVPAIGCKL